MAQLKRASAQELQVNSFTAGNQFDPESLTFSNGSRLFIYENPFTTTDIDIQADYFTASGVRTSVVAGAPGLGYSVQPDLNPSVAVLTTTSDRPLERGFVVWQTNNGTDFDLAARIVDQNGNATTTAPFPLVQGGGNQVLPDVDALSNGRSVVTWVNDTGGQQQIVGQIFQADGQTPASNQFVVATNIGIGATTTTSVLPHGVASLSDGNFVVTWQSNNPTGSNPDTSGYGIHAQIFNANGIALGNEINVNVNTTLDQISPTITALSTGGFAIAWQDSSTRPDVNGVLDNSGTSIHARVFGANGAPVTGELTVNTGVAGNQISPSISSDNKGHFVVAWQDDGGNAASNGTDSFGSSIHAQAFNANGTRIGSEFLVNEITTGNQSAVHLSHGANGSIVATFQDTSNQVLGQQTPDTSGVGIQAEILNITSDYDNVYRFYDTGSNSHFYTSNASEANGLIQNVPSFRFEGQQWSTPEDGTTNVYRFYDTRTGDHFYTTNQSERDGIIARPGNYNYEGVAFHTYDSPQDSGDFTLTRYYNTLTGFHHYSVNAAENNFINSGNAGPGWVLEGNGFVVHTPV